MSQRFVARLRNARMSPRKMRLVADLLRGRDWNAAVKILEQQKKRGARFLIKLMNSAMANVTDQAAQKSLEVDVNRLVVSEIRVDPGPMMKRFTSAPMGRAVPIKRRFCHVTVVLAEGEAKGRGRRQKTGKAKAVKAAPAAAAASAGSSAGAAPAPTA